MISQTATFIALRVTEGPRCTTGGNWWPAVGAVECLSEIATPSDQVICLRDDPPIQNKTAC